MVVVGEGWVFGKGLAVFGFSSPTGATYLLGEGLMHCGGLERARRHGRASEPPLKLTTWNATGRTSGNATERREPCGRGGDEAFG